MSDTIIDKNVDRYEENNDVLLDKYLAINSRVSAAQKQIITSWESYPNKLKNIIIDEKIMDIEHVNLLVKYFLTNVLLNEEIYVNKILLKHYFISQDINSYMQGLPVREEFILRLRTNTILEYDKDLEKEYQKNKFIIDYELSLNVQNVLNHNEKMLTHFTLLKELIVSNVHIGYTRKEKFVKLYDKIINRLDETKLENDIDSIHRLFDDIKYKLGIQNELIMSISDHIETIENKIYSLEECAKFYNVSRERIRQIESKAVTKLYYKFIDNKNQDLDYIYNFKYNATMYQLKKYALLHPVVNLMNKEKSDKIDFSQFFEDYKLTNIYLFNQYLDEEGLIYLNHKYYKRNQATIFNYWVNQNLHRPFSVDAIEKYYTRFLIDFNLLEFSKFDSRTIEGLLERNQSIVKSHGLYHTINIEYKDRMLDYLDAVVERLPVVFSAKLIYNSNEKLFNNADIKDYYELHNFYKKNNRIDYLTFKRVPHIFKENNTVQSFLEQNISDLNSKKITIEDLSNETGIAIETLLNIKSNFNN